MCHIIYCTHQHVSILINYYVMIGLFGRLLVAMIMYYVNCINNIGCYRWYLLELYFITVWSLTVVLPCTLLNVQSSLNLISSLSSLPSRYPYG